MDAVAELPTWAIFVVAFGTPLLAFAGALFGHLITRRAARELEMRARREQLMRTLQWAAELAISDDEARAALGLGELRALADSFLNDPEVQAFVDAALEAVVEPVANAVEDHPDAEIAPAETNGTAGSGEGGADRPAVESSAGGASP